MDIKTLKLDRFLQKEANQNDDTKNAVYAGSNPVPKRGADTFRKIGRPKGSEEDGGAPNILTGTVITSCFIQTSALPSRIELQGNDLTFYDDTEEKNGQVIGDTSRIVFTHDLNSNEGFIMEKRASIYSTYDNVLSWFATPAKSGSYNYMFIGREGTDTQRNLSSLRLAVNEDTNGLYDNSAEAGLNGIFAIEHSIDRDAPRGYLSFISGNTFFLTNGALSGGFSSVIQGGDGGVVGIAYRLSTGDPGLMLYALNVNTLTLGVNLIPDTNNAYDIGSASFQIQTIYASTLTVTTVTATTVSATNVTGSLVTATSRLHLNARTTNSTTAGDVWYYDNGAEGLRMRISGGFTLQFQADIV